MPDQQEATQGHTRRQTAVTPTCVSRPQHRPIRHAILTFVLISYVMILLGNSMIFTGQPALPVFGSLLLLATQAGDLIGQRRLFAIGLPVFGTTSLLIRLAPTTGGSSPPAQSRASAHLPPYHLNTDHFRRCVPTPLPATA
jgi:hypothetical protein